MTKLLIAKPIIDARIDELKKKCLELKKIGLTPKMQVLLVGENQASVLYVRNKKKLCEKVGADFVLKKLPSDIERSVFLDTIEKMNLDPSTTGCFVQLPIPQHLQDIDVTELISAEKDVDGFGASSIVGLYKNKSQGFVPCTPKGILTLFEYYNISLAGKNIVMVGRSQIVGKPLSLLLVNKNATVTLCHSHTKNLALITKSADIVITATGKSRYLTTDFLRDDKSQVIIDVGISKDDQGKTSGDVDFENVKDSVAAITPVPGGVGPLTVLSLIENLVLATEKIQNNQC
jgi:methylenetetrahydrofolate dehydrogenase (NADP+)/methenyltetrahydrofolate cyclohydrolase